MTLIPQGYYQARAVRMQDQYNNAVWARWGKSYNGNHQVLMSFEILDGAHQGTRLSWLGYFTPKTWERTIESLRHCGFEGDDLATINDQTLDRVVSVKVTHETSQKTGKTYARVAFVSAAGGMQLADPMGGDDVRQFAAMMRSKIAGSRAKPSAQSQRPPGPGNGHGSTSGYPPTSDGPDDDIPF